MSLRGFRQTGHPASLVAALMHFDVSFMIWVLVGALGIYISQSFHLTPAQLGFLVGLPTIGGAAFRILLGILTDRFGPRRVGTISMVSVLVPLSLGWLVADSYGALLPVALLLGVAGASFAVSLPLAARWYPPEHQGLAMGIAGAGNSGTVLATLLAPRLAERFGWHAVFGLAMLPVAAAAVAYWLLARDSPEQPARKRLADYLRPWTIQDTWRFNLLYSVTFGGFVGLAGYMSIFFFAQYHVSRVDAGSIAAFCSISGSLCRPLGGLLADRLGGARVLSALYGCIVVLLAGVAILPPLAIAVALLFVTMLVLGMGNGAVFQLVPQRFRADIGVVTGIVGAAGGFGGFLLPNLLGSLKQLTGSYTAGYLAFAGCAVVAFFVLRLSVRSWRSWLPAPHRAASFGAAAPAEG